MNVVEYPRVLVVTSNNFNLVGGGGITLTNLFRGWPADRIANVHEDPTPEDASVCRNFYRLSEEEIRWSWPFSLASSLRATRNGAGAPSVASGEGEAFGVRLARKTLGDGIPRIVRITSRLDHWLRAFQPDIIYSFLGSMAQIRLTRQLSGKLSVPVVVHIMDDWPTVLYRRGALGPLLRRIVEKEFQMVLKEAAFHMAISEEMCREYRVRYGYRFAAFHNVLDVAEWFAFGKKDWKAGIPFVVRYVGSIVPDGQREGIRDVSAAIANLRRFGNEVELWLHTPTEQVAYLRKEGIEGVNLTDPPSSGSVAQTLASADLLVLPFNFDARSIQYLRLSHPTKLPAYMASGAPILVYGPAGIAIVQYAQREGWGHVVSSGGVPALENGLGRLMSDAAAREQLGRRAQHLALERYDAARLRPAFHETLRNAARMSRVL